MAPPFQPLWLLRNRHLQTVAGAFSFPLRTPPSVRRVVDLPDGDQVALEVSTPPGWSRREPTVVMVHGLTGSHRSAYMIRLAGKLYERGWRAVRMNLRGCGSGFGLARRPYHGGCSDDVLAVLEAYAPEGSPLILAGFSLGGNIALKLAGELGERGCQLLREVVTYCPAADLQACYQRVTASLRGAYERYFVRQMQQGIRDRNAVFPDDPHPIPDTTSLYEFDDVYTAPLWGFGGAANYYAQASAKPLMEQIRVPTRIALAKDDPVIDPTVFDGVTLPDCVRVRHVAGGGHLGFLARPGAGGVQWMDTHLLRAVGA